VSEQTHRNLAWQILPPLLLLWPASTRNGPTLYIAGVLFLIVSVFSVISILIHPLRENNERIKLVRPILSVTICALAFLHTHLSLHPARIYVNELSKHIQKQCNRQSQCPASIPGWPSKSGHYSSASTYGSYVKWPILYHSNGSEFELRLYIALDIGESSTGGVQKALGASP